MEKVYSDELLRRPEMQELDVVELERCSAQGSGVSEGCRGGRRRPERALGLAAPGGRSLEVKAG